MDNQDVIDIMLLASGFSRRFGPENKLLRKFRGQTLVEHALHLACSLEIAGTIFLLHAAPEVGDTARKYPVQILHNCHPERGLRESVRLGVEASSAGYYLFMHCDQPFLDTRTVEAILAQRRPGGIAVPTHGGKPGNPALFSSFFRDELVSLGQGETPKCIKNRHPARVAHVEIDNPESLLDIDTLDDAIFCEKRV